MSEVKPEKLRILIVDDNHLNLMVMKHMFNFNEYDVHFAECGEAALEMARKFSPHLILLDVVMPDLSGFEVCSRLKQDDNLKDSSVIFISAANEIDFKIQAFETGGVDFITKPFRKEEILQRIKKHIAQRLSPIQLNETVNTLRKIKNAQHKLFAVPEVDLNPPDANARIIFEFMSNEIIDPTKDESYKKNIVDLLANLDKSASAVENLHNWAATESDKLKIEPENINLKEAVVSLVNLYQHDIQSRNIQLNTRLDADHVVFADQTLLKTIIRNLLSNALKYTPSGGSVSFDSAIAHGFVKIAVADSGTGISPDILEKIFDPGLFFSTKGLNNEIGNGLGLKLCREFVAKSQGRLWIESTPRKGTTVFFTLPAKNENLITDDARSLVW